MADWFKDWFASDFYLSVYNHRNDEDAEKFLNGLLELISLSKGAKILDAACGAGRHSLFMARKKFDVTAFDLSLPLLNKGIEKGRELNLDIKFFNGDLRFIHLKERFDLIMNLFTSFGYFNNDEENFSFIKSAYEMLKEDGYFVFDYLNEQFLRKNLVPESGRNINGLKIFEKREIIKNRIVKKITIENGRERRDYEESVQLYSFDEIIRKFNEIGFSARKVWGNYSLDGFIPDTSERIIIIFKK